MKPEIKEILIPALESGKYPKGKNMLRTPDGAFCCLGVLCDLYHKATGLGSWAYNVQTDRWSFFPHVGEKYHSDISLPKRVQEWAGLVGPEGYIPEGYWIPNGRQYHSLTGINDITDTFAEVIDAVKHSVE